MVIAFTATFQLCSHCRPLAAVQSVISRVVALRTTPTNEVPVTPYPHLSTARVRIHTCAWNELGMPQLAAHCTVSGIPWPMYPIPIRPMRHGDRTLQQAPASSRAKKRKEQVSTTVSCSSTRPPPPQNHWLDWLDWVRLAGLA